MTSLTNFYCCILPIHLSVSCRYGFYVVPASCRSPTLTLTYCSMRSPTYGTEGSLCHWHNQTLVSNICKASPISLFWATKLLEMHFEFPFNPIGKSTGAFATDQSWQALKSWYTGEELEQGFWCCLQKDLTRSLVPAVAPVIPRVFAKTGIGCRCLAYNNFFWIPALFTSNCICIEFVCFNLVP